MKIKDKDGGGEVRSTLNRWLGAIVMAVGDGNTKAAEMKQEKKEQAKRQMTFSQPCSKGGLTQAGRSSSTRREWEQQAQRR